ncbi:unnamed protein product [Chironomus riparius]|uniref:Cytochrome P450 n=1 Tax=Chironomus riparius TaxID=315576 RepID=A0A9N9WMX7_9DIPT|nr:unnamed protein product [Chironomus riparius]
MSFLIFIVLIATAIYFINQYLFSYWSRQGIPFKKPVFLLGELSAILSRNVPSLGEFFENFYKNYKQSRILGIYFSYRPTLMVCDPILIQEIMIKDFGSFHDRGIPADEEIDPLSAHLFSLSGQRWRDLRVKLSPTFTSGKLKGMYPTIFNCAQTMQKYLEKEMKNGTDNFDTHDLLARFTTSIISSVAFGIENDCINDRENIFRKMGLKIFDNDYKLMIKNILATFLPKLTTKLRMKRVVQEVEDFFLSVVRQTIEHRDSNESYQRKDFMQLLIQLKNQGFISVDKDENDEDEVNFDDFKSLDTKKLTFNQVAAQTFLFFVAGFETSSSTSNLCLFELSRNPKIQQKVQEEIDQVMKDADSTDITYDMLQKLKYLEMCIDETLRKFPIVPLLVRECTKNHTFSGTEFTIEKGTQIFIPCQGLHRDPDFYANPMEFDPERFRDSPNGSKNTRGLFYLPFGDGPRNCIGLRMGKLQTKIGLATILSKFSCKLVDESLMHKEFEADPSQFIIKPKVPIVIKFMNRK